MMMSNTSQARQRWCTTSVPSTQPRQSRRSELGPSRSPVFPKSPTWKMKEWLRVSSVVQRWSLFRFYIEHCTGIRCTCGLELRIIQYACHPRTGRALKKTTLGQTKTRMMAKPIGAPGPQEYSLRYKHRVQAETGGNHSEVALTGYIDRATIIKGSRIACVFFFFIIAE